jgi:hypothetical protein
MARAWLLERGQLASLSPQLRPKPRPGESTCPARNRPNSEPVQSQCSHPSDCPLTAYGVMASAALLPITSDLLLPGTMLLRTCPFRLESLPLSHPHLSQASPT